MEEFGETLRSAHELAESGLHESARALAGLLLSALPPGSKAPQTLLLRAQALLLLARCLAVGKEHKRALSYFDAALQVLGSNPKLKSSTEELQFEIRMATAQSSIAQRDFHKAKRMLDPIPERSRSVPMLRLLATACEGLGEPKGIVEFHELILKACPSAVESAIALLDNGVPFVKVEERLTASKPIRNLVLAHAAAKRAEYKESLDRYLELKNNYPGNLDVILRIAECHLDRGDPTSAQLYLTKARSLDSNIVTLMDRQARLWQLQGKLNMVAKIAEELHRITDERPEPWLALACYNEMRNDSEKALFYVDKVRMLAKTRTLMINLKRPDEALAAYRMAYRYSRDISVYEGLVECHISMSKISDAKIVAREAHMLFPKNARALAIVGIVLSHTDATTKASLAHTFKRADLNSKQAIETFKKALQNDSLCLTAVFGLANVYAKTEQLAEAINLIKEHLTHHHSDAMHARLGLLYHQQGDFDKAVEQFNAALRINPECAVAREGLAETDREINGVSDEGIDAMDEGAEEEMDEGDFSGQGDIEDDEDDE
ncbi:Anaphase promoting complex subunit 7 [Polyrhizophydium stewartii]|uniref:Anaphase promoting complex subunit 7 n=1 Tax=Polyrhizophydium stewartii TaxID=2732419 RepID=A0ABR4N4X4_9FUNG